MLDRKKYEEQLKRVKEEQIEELAKYLQQYTALGEMVRDMPVAGFDVEKKIEEIKNIPFSPEGRDPKEVAEELVEKGFNESMMLQHPKFFSFVTSAVSPYALAGAILADIYNVNVCGFEEAPTIGIIEEKLIKWMGGLAGWGEECGGLFTSGGSLSNLTGFIAARDNLLKPEEYPIGVAYVSDQTHSSGKKGLRMMGLRYDQIKIIPTDDEFKIRTDLLEEEIKKDLEDGKKPFLIVGTIGTTNTGSIDPLKELGAIKEKYNTWLHVDGAFGGSILFSGIYNHLAAGIELADTMSWDTHKWAMQGYSSSCLIAKDKKKLVSVFAEHPEYLQDVINEEHTDGWDMGIEMSRPARCVKLWFTVQAMGTDLLSDVIDYSFFNSHQAKRALEELEGWEITSEPMCGTITFRYAPAGVDPDEYDEMNARISEEIIKSGYAYIVTTVIKGNRVLRMNMINGNMTDKDVTDTIHRLDNIAHEIYG